MGITRCHGQTNFGEDFLKQFVNPLNILKVKKALLGFVVETHNRHWVIEKFVKPRLAITQPLIQDALDRTGEMGNSDMCRCPHGHALTVNPVEGLNEMCGVEASFKINGMLAHPVQGNGLRTGGRVSDENSAVRIVLEDSDALLRVASPDSSSAASYAGTAPVMHKGRRSLRRDSSNATLPRKTVQTITFSPRSTNSRTRCVT